MLSSRYWHLCDRSFASTSKIIVTRIAYSTGCTVDVTIMVLCWPDGRLALLCLAGVPHPGWGDRILKTTVLPYYTQYIVRATRSFSVDKTYLSSSSSSVVPCFWVCCVLASCAPLGHFSLSGNILFHYNDVLPVPSLPLRYRGDTNSIL